MKNEIGKNTTIQELAGIVYGHLIGNGITATLTGGSVVSIYTNNKYESQDLDFISPDDHKRIVEVMAMLRFTPDPKGKKNLRHPLCPFTVEFPGRITMIGGALEKVDHEVELNGVRVKMLSPTQSAMDRIAAFIAWKEVQGLDQAEWICEKQPVNLKKILTWAKGETATDEQLKIIRERCQRGIKKFLKSESSS